MTGPLVITVRGTPAPQGSKRAFAVKRAGAYTGRVAVVEQQHDRVRTWRQAILDAIDALHLSAIQQMELNDWRSGPITLDIEFRLKRPKSHYRAGRNSHLLRDTAPARPGKMPDLSKLIRATEDAITDSGRIWDDDGQVVTIHAAKHWAAGVPGAVITISETT